MVSILPGCGDGESGNHAAWLCRAVPRGVGGGGAESYGNWTRCDVMVIGQGVIN